MRTNKTSHIHPATGTRYDIPLYVSADGREYFAIGGAAEDGGDGGDGGDGDGGDDAAAKAAADKAAADKAAADKAAADAAAKGGDDSPWSDPEKAKSEIERLRRENASSRTTAKEQAAKEAREAALNEVAKALGLKDGEAPTVEELSKQLSEQTEKTEQTSSQLLNTQAELVVWRNADDLKVDAQALTDSRAFAAAIKDFDPSDDKFEENVKKAAQEAAEKNPKLKAAQEAGKGGAEISGGSGEGADNKPKSMAEAINQRFGG